MARRGKGIHPKQKPAGKKGHKMTNNQVRRLSKKIGRKK